MHPDRFSELRRWYKERGLLWTNVYLVRWVLYRVQWKLRRFTERIENILISIERRRLIVGTDTASSSYHTVQVNKEVWTNYDWSNAGEEWTSQVRQLRGMDPEEWKHTLVRELMLKYFSPGETLLEIGPGAGRWTESLLKVSDRLLLADITERCLEVCRVRFEGHPNISYHMIKNQMLPDIPTASVDGVWSYDVFVHINPHETDRYLALLKRLLRSGGVAILHHAGIYVDPIDAKVRFRSYMNADIFRHLVEKHDLELLEQDTLLPHYPGDVISIFRKRLPRAAPA